MALQSLKDIFLYYFEYTAFSGRVIWSNHKPICRTIVVLLLHYLDCLVLKFADMTIWCIVSRLVAISGYYASHPMLRVSCDSLIWTFSLDTIQCVGWSYCSNNVYFFNIHAILRQQNATDVSAKVISTDRPMSIENIYQHVTSNRPIKLCVTA